MARAESERRKTGTPLLDLTETNPTAVGITYPVTEIAAALGHPEVARYLPTPRGLESARRAIAADYQRSGSKISEDDLLVTASSSESYSFLFKLLCDPGDAVLVPQPSYPLFEYLAALDGVRPVPYHLAYDGTWQIDFSTIDEALHAMSALNPIRAIVIVSPHNPTGWVLTEAELAALDQRAQRHNLAIISDEVFADYVDRRQPSDRYVRCVAAATTAAVSFSLGGISKSLGLPHLKLGWIAVGGPPEDRREVYAALELIGDTYLSVGTPVQAALPALFDIGAGIRSAIAERIVVNRTRLHQALASHSSVTVSVTVIDARHGWSAILRLPAIISDEAWALALLNQDHVLIHPGYLFDLLPPLTCLVLSLLPPPDEFSEAVERLARRIEGMLSQIETAPTR